MNKRFQTEVEEFRELSTGYWTDIWSANSKAGNAKNRRMIQIADKWENAGVASTLLIPLLHDESPKIRFAAAAHLMTRDGREQAIDVLRQLIRTEDSNLISTSAHAVLRVHKVG